MKICIPVENREGINAKVFAHFGSAPYFLIFDTDSEKFNIISNIGRRHQHGMCHPLKMLEHQNINAVICKGMGARAVQILNEGGIKAYKAGAGIAREIIECHKEGILEEITVDNACVEHDCH